MRNENIYATTSTRGALGVAALLIALVGGAALAQQPDGEPIPVEAPTTRPSTGPLVFVGPTHNAPYSFLDSEGLPTGYDVDVMNAIAERLRRSITVELMDAAKATAAIADGAADGVIGMGAGQAAPEDAWSLCGPTVTRNYRIAVTLDNNWLSDDAIHHDLSGLRIAVGRHDPVTGLFEANRSVTLELVDSPVTACDLVHSRRVRGFVADQNTIQYAARRRDDDKLRMIGRQFYRVESYGPAVPTDAEPGLAATLRAAIGELERDGVLADLQTKWFAYEVNPTSYTGMILTIVAAVAGAAVLAGVIFIWLRTLRGSVAKRTRKLHAELEVLRKHVADLQAGDRTADAQQAGAEEAPIAETAPFEAEPADLNALVQRCSDTVQKLVGRRVELSLELGADLPAALVDDTRVERMLIQLCNNARDAIDKQREIHPATPLQIWISTRMADPDEKPANVEGDHTAFVAIAVRDIGCGIRPEMVQRIFHRGYTTKPNAAGRGLTYVYETVAEHGGWIDVVSAADRGATFSIFLPVAQE